MKIYFATTNEGKLEELSGILKRLNLGVEVIQKPLEIPEPQGSLEEIAGFKAKSAYRRLKKPSLALDGGLYIKALKGFPGPYSKFALKTIGLEGILKLVEKKEREAEFRNCLAYLDSDLKEPKLFKSKVKGTLARKPKGKMHDECWSELALIFKPKDHSQTLAEMGKEGFEKWHKRIRENSATYKFAKWLNKKL